MSELCSQWSILALDVSLKALLLAVVTACGIRLLRVRRSNLKHAAWLGVLAGMIGLPWLSCLLPAIPIPIVLRPEAQPAAPRVDPMTHASTVRFDGRLREDPAGPGWKESPPDRQTVSPVDRDVTSSRGSVESATPLRPGLASRFVFRWPVIAFTIWGLGVLAFGTRLALALVVTRQIVRRSTPIATNDLRLKDLGRAGRSAGQAIGGLANIGLRESGDISVPLTTGVMHPQILLPRDWKTWPAEKLRDVLVHEFTHIRRRDCCTALAAGVMASVYWLHPLSWWLRRRLSILAEDCCDDAAIAAAGDRAAYARHLLEIAMLLCHERRRLQYVGLSMARQSDVERRILSILDGNRPLSRTLNRSVTLLLVALMLPVVAVAAALKPADVSSTDKDSANTRAAQPSSDNAATSEEKEYRGKVVGADGQPLVGAEIWFAVSPRQELLGNAPQGTLRRMGASDSRGDFSFRLKPVENAEQFPLEWTHYAAIIAKAPGHGLDWLPLVVFEEDAVSSEERIKLQQTIDKAVGAERFAARTLKLPQEAGPVRGRLVDLEGRPLKGVEVMLEYLQNPDLALLHKGFEEASRDMVNKALYAHTLPQGWPGRRHWQTLVPPVKTDDRGEFSLSGLGRDQVATVTLSGDRVEAERFFIVGTDMETKRLPHISMYPKGAQDSFVGVNFALAVGPAIPVSGVVTEFKTGKPIAGAMVHVERLFSREGFDNLVQLRLYTSHIRTVTDQQGRYRLVGIPPGEQHVLNVVPPTSQPWLIASQTFSLDPGQPTATVNMQVFRGIWIEGKVTDADTGEPIRGCVDYLALRTNKNIPQEFGLQDGWESERFLTDAEGRYRTAGLPGPGVLLTRSFGKKIYPRSVGAEKVEGYDPGINYVPTTPIGMPLSNWNSIQVIDPAVDAESYSCDLTLSAGVSLAGRIVAPNDAPVSSIEALGLVEKRPFFGPLMDDTFTLIDYRPEVPRDLFFKTADGSLVGYLHLEGKPPADVIVRLQPSVTVWGTLIETETDDPAAGYNLFCESSQRGEFRIDDTTTDKEGAFETKGLMAGNVYQMNCGNVRRFVNQKNRFTIDLTAAKPGDRVELGAVTGKNAKRKE
ncbi:MAG TPA: M56 family metallopeptidase [Pirellulales bacterium]|jgi:beta-lactamase regulating signal transducer with metallopeptidase domain|nr:M56 family metallopeptidase [Pirellulales bacterium]